MCACVCVCLGAPHGIMGIKSLITLRLMNEALGEKSNQPTNQRQQQQQHLERQAHDNNKIQKKEDNDKEIHIVSPLYSRSFVFCFLIVAVVVVVVAIYTDT